MTTARQRHMRELRDRNRGYAAKGAFPAVNWAGYAHHELYNMIHNADSHRLHDAAGGWRMLSKAIGGTTEAVQGILTRLANAWGGVASERARESNDKITQWAAEATDKIHQVGDALHQYAGAVHWAQRVMPPPEFAYAEAGMLRGDPYTVVDGPAKMIEIQQLLNDQKPNFDKHHAAYQEAIRVMQRYAGESQIVHDDLPPFPQSPRRAVPVDPGPDQPTPLPLPTPTPTPPPPPIPDPPRPDDRGAPDGRGAGSPVGNGPAGTTTTAFADPAVVGPYAGGQPGTGPYGPGSGADSSRAGLVAGLGSGGGIAGAPGARPGAGPGSLARGGPGAAQGAHGANGFYPPMAGAGTESEEDAEHRNKYDEGLDLFDDLPPSYPPVFGL